MDDNGVGLQPLDVFLLCSNIVVSMSFESSGMNRSLVGGGIAKCICNDVRCSGGIGYKKSKKSMQAYMFIDAKNYERQGLYNGKQRCRCKTCGKNQTKIDDGVE